MPRELPKMKIHIGVVPIARNEDRPAQRAGMGDYPIPRADDLLCAFGAKRAVPFGKEINVRINNQQSVSHSFCLQCQSAGSSILPFLFSVKSTLTIKAIEFSEQIIECHKMIVKYNYKKTAGE
jgi:hypothetical protein